MRGRVGGVGRRDTAQHRTGGHLQRSCWCNESSSSVVISPSLCSDRFRSSSIVTVDGEEKTGRERGSERQARTDSVLFGPVSAFIPPHTDPAPWIRQCNCTLSCMRGSIAARAGCSQIGLAVQWDGGNRGRSTTRPTTPNTERRGGWAIPPHTVRNMRRKGNHRV